MLADNPGLTPNQVKARLLGTTNPGPVGNPFVDGHGALNAYAAATAGPMDSTSQPPACSVPCWAPRFPVAQRLPPTPGTPSLWSGITWNQAPDGGGWNG